MRAIFETVSSNTALAAFASFGLASQVILVVFFAGRRWRLSAAERYGWVVYAFGALGGAALGIWLISFGASWRLFVGPLLFAVWSAYGAWADLLRRIEWRWPIQWNVFGPYLVLYMASQMFLWWPLWTAWRTGWAIYLVLFVANTGLNMSTHLGARAKPTGPST